MLNYLLRKLRNKTYVHRMYLPSKIGGLINQIRFEDIHTYCMFIGYPRSGHTFIGAIINGHPNALIGIQTDVLRLIKSGFKKRQIFYLIYKNSQSFTKVHKNTWSGYSYRIPESYQGTYTDLLVIGDKQGGKSTYRIGEKPTLLSDLAKVVEMPVKLFHVVRNPFDIISTMYNRNVKNKSKFDRRLLEHKIDHFFKKADVNLKLILQEEFPILTIYHEAFIKNPKNEINRIFDFINLKVNDQYLENCKSVIYKEPHLSRFNLHWPEDLQKRVQDNIINYPFLTHYKF